MYANKNLIKSSQHYTLGIRSITSGEASNSLGVSFKSTLNVVYLKEVVVGWELKSPIRLRVSIRRAGQHCSLLRQIGSS